MSTRTVALQAPLTFEHAADHTQALTEHMFEGDSLVVDIGECGAIDLAGVQVLIAAFHSATARGVSVTYTNAERYRRICEYAGIEPAGTE